MKPEKPDYSSPNPKPATPGAPKQPFEQPDRTRFPGSPENDEPTEPTLPDVPVRREAPGTNPQQPAEEKAPDGEEEATVEDFATRFATPPAIFAAAKASQGWGAQKRLTRDEYEKVIEATKGIRFR